MENYKFSALEYKRPDLETRRAKLAQWKAAVWQAENYEALRSLIFEIDHESCELFTQYSIAHIRHTLDTRDEFYEAEINYLQDTLPTLSGDEVALSEAIAASPFRADIEREFGKQYFVSMDLQKKLFCEANIPLRQQESRLTNEYQKIMATAEIAFDGKTLNLYGVQKYFEHPDRRVRAAAVKAYSKFYEDNEPRLEEIWSELIRIRNQMGRNLGYENYIPVGYLEQGRTDYGEKEVASFREQVRTVLVPFCQKLYDAQAKRLGIDHVMWYDEKMVFPDGNAEPAGDDAFMVRTAQKMYHEISPETGEFIDFMIDHELMDLQNKPGKASTGYMAMRSQPIADFYSESTDIAEIHSMSMEQFAYPYAEWFFGDQADKFRFAHLQEALTFVPFGVAVDEFQHICYAHPEMTPKERTYQWHLLEEKYMPWRRYEDDAFMERGGYWYHKLHIYLYPFYYINYTLTTMGAMEFKKKYAENRDAAWQDYLKLCKTGGSRSYLETLRYANLANPFEPGSVERACGYAEEILLKQIAEQAK